MGLIRATKWLIFTCLKAIVGTVEHTEEKMLCTQSNCCKSTVKGIIGICFLGLLLVGARAYQTYRAYENLPSCREKIEYLIHHKLFFTILIKSKRFTQDLLMHVTSSQKRSASVRLAHWLEGRLVKHLENKDIQSVRDLPLLERSVIRTLDSTTRVSGILLNGISSLMSFFGLG